jgi:hypothetical protein
VACGSGELFPEAPAGDREAKPLDWVVVSARPPGLGKPVAVRVEVQTPRRGRPSTTTLSRFAKATGHKLKISFEPVKSKGRRVC